MPLLILRFQEVEVDYCDRCRGLWLDAGEIEELLGPQRDDMLVRALNQPAEARPTRYLCPRCDQPLHEIPVLDVKLDRCPTGHGLWFDDGELRRVLARGGAQESVAYLNALFGKT